MCKPISEPDTNLTKSTTTSSNRLIYAAAFIPIVLFVVIPFIISESAGGFSKFYTSNRFRSSQLKNIAGKNVIVTGGNTGIGFETAKSLALAGANVVLTTRSKAKGEVAVNKIIAAYKEANPSASSPEEVRVSAMICDQNSLRSVKKFANEYKKLNRELHLIVLNAGIMKSPGAQFIGRNMTYGYGLTEDGFEQHIGVNHIAHQYLTQLLEKELVAAAPDSRVVSVASTTHSGSFAEGIRPETWSFGTKKLYKNNVVTTTPEWYEDGIAYGQSKLANIMFAKEYASRMGSKNISAYSLHPGIIRSDLTRYMDVQFKKEAHGQSFVESLFAALFARIWFSSNMDVRIGSMNTLYLATAP
ncbi:hypothetical protein ACHAXS_011869, partial [Conticribra weissflogii]